MDNRNERELLKEAEQGIKALFTLIGEDTARQGLAETPHRFIKAIREITRTTGLDEKQFLVNVARSFDIGEYDQMVLVRDIPFRSLCEHHVLPFVGTVTIAYIPTKTEQGCKVLGLSKMARIVDFYSSRLQVQERLTAQIATAMQQVINPVGVGVFIQSEHNCMALRGIKAVGANAQTLDVRGILREDLRAKEEFLSLVK